MLRTLLGKMGVYQDPTSLKDDQLESAYVLLRKEALSNSKVNLPMVYRNRTIIIRRILERHKTYYSDELSRIYEFRTLSATSSLLKESGDSKFKHLFKRTLAELQPYGREDDEGLLFACFYMFDNNHALGRHGNYLISRMMLTILDYLIEERKYKPAQLLKGLAFKYGVDAISPPNIYESERLLLKACNNGITSASLELERIRLFY